MALIGDWHFTAADGARDRCGNFDDLDLRGFAGLTPRGLELGWGSWARAAYRDGPALREKTLVVWVRLAKTEDERPGGSVMTLSASNPDAEPFDGLAFGDLGDCAWLVASDYNRRTRLEAVGQEDEARSWGKLVKLAVTWRDAGQGAAEVRLVRQPIGARQRPGELVALQRYTEGQLADFAAGSSEVSFGPRYRRGGEPIGYVTGCVVAAQVHDEVLSDKAIARLRPPLVRSAEGAAGIDEAVAAETFALIVGVQDYSFLDASARRELGHSDLRGTLGCVRSYASLARLMGIPAENIRVLTGPKVGPNDFESVVMGRQVPVDMNMVDARFGHATEAGLREGLAWLAAQLRARPDSQGMVFLAGHSVTTTAGHLAFAPLDTRLRPVADTAAADRVADDEAWWRHLEAGGLLRRLAQALGNGDPGTVQAAFADCFGEQGEVSPASISAAVAAHGGQLASAETREALRDLVQLAGGRFAQRSFDYVRAQELDLAGVREALQGDPLAADAQLEGLVSFQHLMATGLVSLPEDRAVTFVLETCLPEGPGRTLRQHYRTNGLPLAHGNIVALASCSLGQSSYAGVFDNRWHGAFTWALTSLLSQWDVEVTNVGRYFRQDYARLLTLTTRVLRTFGFAEQEPFMWSQPWAREWPVFGRGELEEQIERVGVLERVKVREEISPGETGHIWVIGDTATGSYTTLGFLISVAGTDPQRTIDGVTLQTNRDYWFWSGTAFPESTFFLRRPATTPSGNTLAAWIDSNVSGSFNNKITFLQGQFQAPQGPPPPGPSGAGHSVRKGGQIVGYLKELASDPDGRIWWRSSNATMDNKRIELVAASAIAPASGVVVEYKWESGPPSATWVDQPVEDVPQG